MAAETIMQEQNFAALVCKVSNILHEKLRPLHEIVFIDACAALRFRDQSFMGKAICD